MAAFKVGWTPAADWLADVGLGCYQDDEHSEDQHSVSGIELVREGVSPAQTGVRVISYIA